MSNHDDHDATLWHLLAFAFSLTVTGFAGLYLAAHVAWWVLR